MNESFEVILNNEQFQNYKQLQKNADISDKALRELRRDIENYKLRCDQQQLALSNYELKIKELSKNSIRLSRRLIAEQEEHFATQESFLAREKQLLEKLLMLSNDHENGAAILLTVREAKNKLETENGTLKRKIVEQEKEIESLGLESKQLKKQLVALSDRCTIAEGQQLIALKQRDELKVRVGQLSLEMQKSLRKMAERLQADEESHTQQIKKITQVYQKQIKQAESKYQQLLGEKTLEIEQLSRLLSNSEQESKVLRINVQALQMQLKDRENQHLKKKILLSQLTKSVQELQTQSLNQAQDIRLCLKHLGESLKKDGAALQNMFSKCVAASDERIKEASINTEQKLLEQIWKFMHRQLQTIRTQLKKDQIAEEHIILTLQFSRAITQLKIQMDKQLSNKFNSWLTK